MITRHEVEDTGRLSRVLVGNGIAYLSGLTARDRTQGVREQTADILAQIDHYLAMAGTNKSKVLTCNVWLKDIRTYDEMNAVWLEWVDKQKPPARATVEARLLTNDRLVEIQLQALV